MTKLTMRTPTTGPITVALTAPGMQLTVEAVPGLTEATLELSGPDETVRQATATSVETAWVINVPAPAPTVISGRGATVISGDVFGSVVMSGGTTVINGAKVTNGTVMGATEPVTGLLRVPMGSLLGTRIDNGSVDTRGALAGVYHQGRNSGVSVDVVGDLVSDGTNGSVSIGRAHGEIDVSTTNGSVSIGRCGPLTKVRSTNGNVLVHAGCPGRISARTTNGNVSVHKAGHRVDATTSTTNGRDRVYA
ncbi:hypothetical protein DFP74_2344 [Nocardiopsis sp. Huas11]|uniref:hypothetical protein n=1 Tax=Nocardiopsis sp. Huas11 TaxID=2183912 RepID=UPI000EACBDEC|nr:hypothetical protein [Nocardiopsis sp. Huas11]RKS06701.1 hypothetical protein DFP74_2344 [Nocardiopsis sp. Huas11]